MFQTVAVFGDSISTFEGCVPTGNAVYYEGEKCSQNGVEKPADTWWMQVADALSSKVVANTAYSGSLVSGHEFPAGASEERAAQLTAQDGMPAQAVIIYMGINDYGEGVAIDEFKTAYATLLENIRERVPEAEILCSTLLPGRSQEHDVDFFCSKYKGENLEDYNEAIREAAAAAEGARVVDVAAVGSPFDTLDGTHPTKLGMKQLAAAFLEALDA